MPAGILKTAACDICADSAGSAGRDAPGWAPRRRLNRDTMFASISGALKVFTGDGVLSPLRCSGSMCLNLGAGVVLLGDWSGGSTRVGLTGLSSSSSSTGDTCFHLGVFSAVGKESA